MGASAVACHDKNWLRSREEAREGSTNFHVAGESEASRVGRESLGKDCGGPQSRWTGLAFQSFDIYGGITALSFYFYLFIFFALSFLKSNFTSSKGCGFKKWIFNTELIIPEGAVTENRNWDKDMIY